MSGVVAAVSAVASLASAGAAIATASKSAPKLEKSSAASANDQIDDAAAKNRLARSSLLATAGGSAGAELQPGQVGGSSSTLFGN